MLQKSDLKQALKGVKKELNITHAQFEKCLAAKEKLKVSASHIRQKNHTLKTVQELKMALTP